MEFEDLLEKLEYNLHNTCKKYNLYFKKKDEIWTIINKQYNNEYYSKKYDNIRNRINK